MTTANGSESMLGRYQAPTADVADGYARQSLYVTMDDGCRIAVDVLRPARGGTPLTGAHPTVLHATPYRRAWVRAEGGHTAARYEDALAGIEPGQIVTQYEARPIAKQLIHQGYNFVSVDMRGTGASFGASYLDSWRSGRDLARIVEWITEQPWGADKVGMVGISYEGMIQCFTSAFAPRGLACVAPQYPGLPQCYVDGGVAIASFARTWQALHQGLAEEEPSAPVEGAEGPQLNADAQAERDPDRYRWVETFAQMDPRDVTRMASYDGLNRTRERSDLGLPEVASGWSGAHDLLNAAGVPTYIVTGWWDLTFPGYLIDAYNRLSMPKKLIVGPWNHGQGGDPELMRWFDYWLKGESNGVMSEAPVHYSVSDGEGGRRWMGAPRLPLPEAQPRSFYLDAASSGTIESAHDGSLSDGAPAAAGAIEYDVDHEVTLGRLSRHSYYAEALQIEWPDLAERGAGCLTFTSAPLADDVEIVGWPSLELELSTDRDCGAVVATLELVRRDGAVVYLSEGYLNLEHRRTTDAPLGHGGAVWHSWSKSDLAAVAPGESMEAQLELYPIGALAQAGERLRLTIAGADADNLIVPTQGGSARLELQTGGERPSRLSLPVVNRDMIPTAQEASDAFAGTPPKFAMKLP